MRNYYQRTKKQHLFQFIFVASPCHHYNFISLSVHVFEFLCEAIFFCAPIMHAQEGLNSIGYINRLWRICGLTEKTLFAFNKFEWTGGWLGSAIFGPRLLDNGWG